jgi:hypothetical protein
MANATADIPEVSETKLARMKKDELREYARGIGHVEERSGCQGQGARRAAAKGGKGTKDGMRGNSTADTPDVSETKLAG